MADIEDEGSSSMMAEPKNADLSSDSKVAALRDTEDEDPKADSTAEAMPDGLYDGAVLTLGAVVDLNNSAIAQTRSISWKDAVRPGSVLLPPLTPPLYPWGHSDLVGRAYERGGFPPVSCPSCNSHTCDSDCCNELSSINSEKFPELSYEGLPAQESMGFDHISPQDGQSAQEVIDPIDRNLAEYAQNNPQFAQAVAVDQSQPDLNDYISPWSPATIFGSSESHIEGVLVEEEEAHNGWGQFSPEHNNWDQSSSAGEPNGQDADDAEWKSSPPQPPPQPSHQQLQGLSSPSLGEPSQRSASLIDFNEPDQTYSEGVLAYGSDFIRGTIADLQLPPGDIHRNIDARSQAFTNEEFIIAGRMYLEYKRQFGVPPPQAFLEGIGVLLNSEFTSWLDDRYNRMCKVRPKLPAELDYDPLSENLTPEQEERETARTFNIAREFTELSQTWSLEWEQSERDIELSDVSTFSITQQEFDAELEGSVFDNKESALEREDEINSPEDVAMQESITPNEDRDADSSSIENAAISLGQVAALQRPKSAEMIVDCIPSNASFDTNLDGHPTEKASIEERASEPQLEVNLTRTIGDDTMANVDMEMAGALTQNIVSHHAELPALQSVSRSSSTETIRNAMASDLDPNGNSYRDKKSSLEEITNQDLETHVTSSESTSGNTPASEAATYGTSMDAGLGLPPNEKTVACPDLNPVVEKEPQSTSAGTISCAYEDMSIDIDEECPAKKACLEEMETMESKLKGSPLEKISDASAANVDIIDSRQPEKASLGESKGFAPSLQYTAIGTIHGTSSSEKSHDMDVDRHPVEMSGLDSEPQGRSTEVIPQNSSNVSRFDTWPDRLNYPVTFKTAEDDLDQPMEVDNDDEVSLIQISPIRPQSPIPIPKADKCDKLLKSTRAPSVLAKKSTKNIFAAVESRKAGASYMQAPTAGSSWSWGGGATPRAQPIQPMPFHILPASSSSDTINFGSPPHPQNPPEPAAIPPHGLLRQPPYLDMNSASPVTSQTHRRRSLRSTSDSAYATPNMIPLGSSPFGDVSHPSRNLSVSPNADASQPSQHYSSQDSSPTPGPRIDKRGGGDSVLLHNPSIPLPNPNGLPSKPPGRLASLRPRKSSTGNMQVSPRRPQASPLSTQPSIEIGTLFLNNQQSAQSAAKALRDAVQKEGKPFTIQEDFDMEGAKIIVSAPVGSDLRSWIKTHVVFGRIETTMA